VIFRFCDVHTKFHLRQSVVYSFYVDIRMWYRQTDKRTGLCSVSKKEIGFLVTLTRSRNCWTLGAINLLGKTRYETRHEDTACDLKDRR
jgi:hypothetical protein